MNGLIVIILFALVLRISGSAIREGSRLLSVRIIGWFLCTTAGWVAAGAVGAWSPLWPSLILGIAFAIVETYISNRIIWIAADLIVVAVFGMLSVPPLGPWAIAIGSGLFALAGYALDEMVIRSSRRLRVALMTLPVTGALILGFFRPDRIRVAAEAFVWLLESGALPHIGIASNRPGQRISLESGATAWLEHPASSEALSGALVFHGAHEQGSNQPAAAILRRALLDAGFLVLSLDHIGYGESPNPSLESEIEAWDPLPSILEAYGLLGKEPTLIDTFAVGHSMGASDVFRLLGASSGICAGIVLGASSDSGADYSEYWYERFHSDRNIEGKIPLSNFFEIESAYYDEVKIASEVPANQSRIHFIRFENDWPNVMKTRNALYDLLPRPKSVWDLEDSSHYFNSKEEAGAILGDTRVTSTLASWFRTVPLCSATSMVPQNGAEIGLAHRNYVAYGE